VTSEIALNKGKMNVRIPAGLKAGQYVPPSTAHSNTTYSKTARLTRTSYLLRAELIGLHEGDAAYDKNPIRGAQFYPNCVQLEVQGDGKVELPAGVGFPGAYKFEDPGIHYDVYCSTKTSPLPTTPCITTYQIPGPTVWSGAWPTTQAVELGPIKGPTTAEKPRTWIQKSIVTSGTYVGASASILGTSTYQATWSATYQTPAPSS